MTWTYNAWEDTCPQDDYGGDLLVILGLTQLVNHHNKKCDTGVGPKKLSWPPLFCLFFLDLNTKNRVGECLHDQNTLLLWCGTVSLTTVSLLALILRGWRHLVAQQSNCLTTTFLHSNSYKHIMKYCQTQYPVTFQQYCITNVFKWLILSSDGEMI